MNVLSLIIFSSYTKGCNALGKQDLLVYNYKMNLFYHLLGWASGPIHMQTFF